MPLARIGIGANLGNALRTVQIALRELKRYGTLVRASSLYSTKPWGVKNQPDFINAAALLETTLSPRELLGELKKLEAELGREQTYRWGPRVVDFDILAYNDCKLDEPDLILPHPRLHERAFALVPLAEIDPGYESARDALSEEDRGTVTKVSA
ncbi:MAG TPA: 2-amino-4-hydroxy-6-hydroxymethyldihydropteridine diphosphokinase [Candidatus Baltobacteraceae bacterium]